MEPIVPTDAETERLYLRLFQEADWPDLHAYYGDPAATQYTVGRPLTEGQTWRTMASMIGHWSIKGYGPYAVVEKESGRVVGPVGFWYPNDWPSPEIKWALAPAFWGKGYASEAARAVQQIAKIHLPDIRLISFINRENRPSIQLAEAIGAFLEEGDVPFRGGFWHMYRHRTGGPPSPTGEPIL